jgi:protocatechuate 3,4-dioxygenase beta subunit
MRKGASLFLSGLLVLASCGDEPTPDGPPLPTTGAEGAGIGNEAPAGLQEPGLQNPLDGGGSAFIEEEQYDPAIATRVHARVVTEADGLPLVECPVALYWERAGQAVGRIVSTTDADGLVNFPILQRTFVTKLVAMGTGKTAPEFHVFEQYVGAEETEIVEIAVKPAARFAGRVVDLDGNPVPGAKLLAWTEDRWAVETQGEVEPASTGTADENGNFRMGGMPGGPFLLTAAADGMIAVQRATGTNQFDEEIGGIELVLSAANLVSGQVLDDQGGTVMEAIVEAGLPRRRVEHTTTDDPRLVYLPARQWIVQSDRDGGFSLPAVPVGDTWNIRIRHGSFRDFRDRIEAGSKTVEYRLQRGLEVHLSVRDTDSKPISEGDVVILGVSARQTPLRKGYATLRGLEDDPDAIVMLRSSGFAMKTLWPAPYNTDADPMQLVMEAAQPIIGQVLDGNGEPIANTQLTARGLDFLGNLPSELAQSFPGKQPEEVFALNRRIAAEDGGFRFGQLYGGRWEITAITPDGREQTKIFDAGDAAARFIF